MREHLIDQLKPLVGVLLTGFGMSITFSDVKEGVQLVAAIASLVLAIVTIRYYLIKSNILKGKGK